MGDLVFTDHLAHHSLSLNFCLFIKKNSINLILKILDILSFYFWTHI